MKDLHPAARALIRGAKRGESVLPGETRGRVHKSVLRRAAAFGAAMATTTTASMTARAWAVAALLAKPLVSAGAISALAAVGFVVARSAWTPAPPPAHEAIGAPMARVVAPTGQSVPRASEAPPHVVAPPPLSAASALAAIPSSRLPTRGESDPPGIAAAGDARPPGVSSLAIQNARVPGDLPAALELLHRVHGALRAGQPDRALDLLDRGNRILEGGPLAEEALGARISALCRMGRDADARAAIDRLLTVWPRSPLAAQLRGGCTALAESAGPPAN
jgi:hypothetical protein